MSKHLRLAAYALVLIFAFALVAASVTPVENPDPEWTPKPNDELIRVYGLSGEKR